MLFWQEIKQLYNQVYYRIYCFDTILEKYEEHAIPIAAGSSLTQHKM